MNDLNLNIEQIEPCNVNCSFCFLNYTDVLGKNSLFKNLKHKEIGGIIKEIHHQVREYNKGDLLASSGDQYNGLIIIVKGSVVGEITDFEGRTLRIEELRAPDTVASAFIFGDDNTLPVNITALEETKVLIIQRHDLLRLFRQNETIMHNYLDIMANRAQLLSKKLKLLGLQTIRGKIAHYLLELVRKQRNLEIVMPNTQTELSEKFGVARPSIGRTIRELHDDGYIEAKGKRVRILDKGGLSGLLR